jgi:uncharacterized repeat protein (TIGR02543 family)
MKKKRWQYICLFLFFTFVINYCFPCLSVQAELASTPVAYTETGRVSFTDITGHWAEKEIRSWTARELAGGYPDGTFRPDSPITRAEFLALVNRAFGYAEMVGEKLNSSASSVNPVTFHDVAATDWYAVEFAQAAAVGYLGGYPDGTAKPQNPITRQEVATVLARILPPHNDVQSAGTIAKFVDQDQIPAWSEAAIAAAVKGGYMSGYPDGSFQPNRPITRAEALAVLDRAVGMLYNRAGTYGPFQGTVVIEGNATISTPGVTLQNITITGTLYLTEGIGEGDVTLINVTVQGTTKIAGGGRDSIQLRNTTLGAVLVNVPSRKLVRVLAQGDTAVGILEARTPARLEEEELTGSGFTKVVVNNQQVLSQGTQAQVDTSQEGTGTQENTGSQETEPGITVELLGNFDNVEVQAAAAHLDLQKGSIANLNLASTAQGTQIKLATQTSINTVTADTPATVQGQGSINMLEATVDGVVVEAGIINGETKKKKSRDAALSALTYDGKPVPDFAPERLFYEIILPEETTTVPVVQATARHAQARVTVTQATGLDSANNTATVLVTAENGSTQTYTINFVKATVSGITIKTAPTKTEYIEDEHLDLSGLVITLTRTDQSTEEIPSEAFSTKGISTSPEDGAVLSRENIKVTITHTASGKSVEQEITIISTYPVEATVSGGTAVVTADKPKAKAGDLVTINITNLEIGKRFKAITVTKASGEIITTEETEAGKTYTFTMPAEAVTVAVELEVILYTVTFDKNGGDTEADPLTMTVEHGSTVGTLPIEPTREGYVFAGWNTEADGTGAEFDADTVVTSDITVYAQWGIPVSGVSLNKTVLFLQGITTEETLMATIEPANATNKGVTWASDNTAIATVDDNGKVTAVALGTAKITVTTEDGGKEAICWVKVVESDAAIPILDDSCVLYLDGEIGNYTASDTWYDLSGKGNHGTLNNFAHAEGSGWTVEGLQFDGTDDYVEIQHRPEFDVSELTLEVLIKTSSTITQTGYKNLISKCDEAGTVENRDYNLYTYLEGGKITKLHLSSVPLGGGSVEELPEPYEANSIHHIAVTVNDEGMCKYYSDGEEFASYQGNPGKAEQPYNIRICKANNLWEGEILFVRIYNRALLADEIEQNYEASIPVEDISLNKAVLFLEEGDDETLEASI